MVRHSREDAITDEQFDRLFEAADSLEEPFRIECLFVLIVAGRLGLRAGELCHVDESWINWERQQIEIPSVDPCTLGQDGGICGYCRDRAADHADSLTEQRLDEIYSQDLEILEPGNKVTPEVFVEPEDVYHERWEPKTDTGARAVPFGFDDRVKTILEEFFFFRSRYGKSRSSVNRRVNRMVEAAGYPRSLCYPHSLRSTASMFHASRGLNTAALQALMGWTKLDTAQNYIRLSGAQTRRALEAVHSD